VSISTPATVKSFSDRVSARDLGNEAVGRIDAMGANGRRVDFGQRVVVRLPRRELPAIAGIFVPRWRTS